jgi:hypothetical protein
MGERIYQRPDGRFIRYPWSNMSLRLHHLLFCQLRQFRFPELLIGR